jgi:uncharacterized metal-binding protein YceD (DUF177 family)
MRVCWTLSQAWLRAALRETDATPTADGNVEVELTANGSEVVVRGQANVAVAMPCAHTLDPVDVALQPEIFLLLVPATPNESGGRGTRPDRSARGSRRRRSADRPQGGPQRKRRGDSGIWRDDPLLAREEAAEDTYDGERVVLDRFFREFIVLELPMKVIRSDLLLAEDAAIGPSPSEDSVPRAEHPPDPRLAPLAEIANRLRRDKE